MMVANETRVLAASAARTATHNTGQLRNQYWRGLHLVVNVTVDPASASVTAEVQGYDPGADEWYAILTSAAITATGRTVMKVYPGLDDSANTVANDVLPGMWRVLFTHADADSITYSAGAHLLL